MATCPHCGTRYGDSHRICPRDGVVLNPDQSPEQAAVGRTLDGKYRLDAFLSRGGMGAVYRATHLMLNRTVAVKLISSHLVMSADTVRRFQREARAVTQLNHPNIVRVHDLGETSDGTVYFVMDLIAGESLSAVIKAHGPFESTRIVHIFTQVVSALAHAHANGIVHRDLKPQNIMIAKGKDGGEVVTLLDFGIAKSFAADTETKLTSTGSTVGTPHYMSPEQAGGAPVDARSDLYSVGVILYEMLAGEVPFNDPSTPAILVKHLTETPVRPSLKRPDRLVSPALELIAMRCLEKKPESRFQSAVDLLQTLAAIPSFAQPSESSTVLVALPASSNVSQPDPDAGPRTIRTPSTHSTVPTIPPRPVLPASSAARSPQWRTYAAGTAVIALVLAGAVALLTRAGSLAGSQAPSGPRSVSPPPPTSTAAATASGAPDTSLAPQSPPASTTPPATRDAVEQPPRTPAPQGERKVDGSPLSRALTLRVLALMKEQQIPARRFRRADLEITTRPSGLGRGMTADYVATISDAAGEKTFSGNQLGFSELALRNEVVEKAATEIVAYLATLAR